MIIVLQEPWNDFIYAFLNTLTILQPSFLTSLTAEMWPRDNFTWFTEVLLVDFFNYSCLSDIHWPTYDFTWLAMCDLTYIGNISVCNFYQLYFLKHQHALLSGWLV
jgi:hypothetical protein